MESAAEPDDPEFGDDAHCRAALHRPDVEVAEARDDLDAQQLNKIFEVEEAAQIDPEPEHLNEKFEFKEAAQIEPEQEQLNNSFLESNKKQILPRLTLCRFTLSIKV